MTISTENGRRPRIERSGYSLFLAADGDFGSRAAMAARDLLKGAAMWRLWGRLGWNDILQRYRRSVLGPLWLTASMGIMVVALGFLYAELFKLPVDKFLPFLCVGLIVWALLSSFLTEAGTLFIGSESYIKQIRLPYSVYVYRSCWSKLIIFAHNLVIYFGVLIYFQIWPGSVGLLAFVGLALLLVNGMAASLYLGMMSARFRDIPPLITSFVQIVFFVTPIFWTPDLLKGRTFVLDINPFYHLVEIVRAPMLGEVPAAASYVFVLVMTLLNLALMGWFFARFRARISYWV